MESIQSDLNIRMEKENIEKIKNALILALKNSHTVHNNLGESGLEEVRKNEHGDTALKADVEAEKAVLDTLRGLNIPIKVYSEEHGIVDIVENPSLLGVLDGIDGTALYKKERGTGRYSTMFGIFDGINPCYENYLVCGVMEHSTNRLFFTVKGQGSFVMEGENITPINVSDKTKLNKETRIYIDDFGICQKFMDQLSEFKPADREWTAISSATHYVDVASGKVDLVLECTRKGNLEIATAYGLVKEAGGVMVDISNEDISGRRYLEYGQGLGEQLPVISASSSELVVNLIAYLNTKV